MTLFIFILKFSSDEFFFRWDKSGRSITPAPDKIFTQKFFQGIERLKLWLPEVIETPTKPQFQPSSLPWKNVWVNILSGAAVMERPDLPQRKKTRQWGNGYWYYGYRF